MREKKALDGRRAAAAHGSLWGHRDFMLLWAGQSVSEIGSMVSLVAIPIAAVTALDASPLEMGFLYAAGRIPFLLVTLPAGAVIERVAKRPVMLWCSVGRALVTVSIPVAAWLDSLSIAQLFAAATLNGLLMVFFEVAYHAYVPVLLERDQLLAGNSRIGASQAVAQTVGPSVGSGLTGLVGAAQAVAADAVSFAVSAVCLALIGMPEPKGVASGGTRMGQEIAEGMRFVLRHPVLRKTTACSAMANLFLAIAIPLEMIFLLRVLDVSASVAGLLISLGGVGGVVGGAVAAWLGGRLGTARVIWLVPLVAGATGFLVPAAQPGPLAALAAVGWFGSMFAIVVYSVTQRSYRQSICPPELLTRMNASIRWLIWGALPLGGLVGGALGNAIGIRQTLWISVAGVWAAFLWVFFSPLRGIRDVWTLTGAGRPGR